MISTETSQLAQPGPNRTVTSAEDRDEMIRGTKEFPPTSSGDIEDVAQVRVEYASEGHAIGHIPEKGLGRNDPQLAQLVDKIGERLAFERAGVRLYDSIVSKHMAYGGFDGGPTIQDLRHIRQQELEHMHLLARVLNDLGADPPAVTPAANIAATAGKGISDVIVDPRTTLLQSLEALILAELADNECWGALAELAAIAGFEELAEEFHRAHETEEEHLDSVRAWLAAGQGRAAADLPGDAHY